MIVTEPMAREAATLLGVDLASKPDQTVIVGVYRDKIKIVHPDVGGSAEAFIAIDRAKCILLEWLKKQPTTFSFLQQHDCPDCDGKGHFMQSSGRPGRSGLRRQCPRCHGSGDLDLDLHGLY